MKPPAVAQAIISKPSRHTIKSAQTKVATDSSDKTNELMFFSALVVFKRDSPTKPYMASINMPKPPLK